MKDYNFQLETYLKQNGSELRWLKYSLVQSTKKVKSCLTPAQRRRLRKKSNKEFKMITTCSKENPCSECETCRDYFIYQNTTI